MRGCLRLLSGGFEVADAHSLAVLNRLRRTKANQGIPEDKIGTDDELAREAGLTASSCLVETDELTLKKAKLRELLAAQKMKRLVQREAFLEWQAGQREKGAAHRLLRQAKVAEKYKRHHYHCKSGRVLSVAHTPVSQQGGHASAYTDGFRDMHADVGECQSYADFLNPPQPSATSGIVLSLRKK